MLNRNNIHRYSGIQLILLAINGNPKIIQAIDKELDRRALKGVAGQDQREPVPSTRPGSIPILVLS